MTASKNDLISAHHSKRLIKPVLDDLRKLDVQALGHVPMRLKKPPNLSFGWKDSRKRLKPLSTKPDGNIITVRNASLTRRQ